MSEHKFLFAEQASELNPDDSFGEIGDDECDLGSDEEYQEISGEGESSDDDAIAYSTLGSLRGAKRTLSGEVLTVTNWTDVTSDDTEGPDIQHIFKPQNDPGPRDVPGDHRSAGQYFKLFFTRDLVNEIVMSTNRYAEEKLSSTDLRASSRLHKWKPVSVEEMYLVIGLMLNMGIVPQPSLADYWTERRTRRIEFFPKCMTRDRFQLIFHTMLHYCVVDPQKRMNGDRIQPIVDELVKKFQKYFVPYQEVSADETMIGYKGRVSFKQYIPRKPTRWGLLARTLADSHTGYLLNIKMYYGKDQNEPIIGLSKTASTIVTLLEPYLDKGYHVFCDRLYSSLDLADYLYTKKTYLTGTINRNRKGIPQILTTKSKENRAMRDGKILLLNWYDKRLVSMISTYYRGDLTVTKAIRGLDKQIEKPLVIENYNRYMGGVDLSDQYSSYYKFARKSVKWWKKLFFWLLETSVTNSYILFKLTQPADAAGALSLLKFRDELVNDLIPATHDIPVRKSRRLSSSYEPEPNLDCFHAQRKVDKGPKECRYCSKRKEGGARKNSLYYCDTCPGKPGLHPGECFTNYHLGSE